MSSSLLVSSLFIPPRGYRNTFPSHAIRLLLLSSAAASSLLLHQPNSMPSQTSCRSGYSGFRHPRRTGCLKDRGSYYRVPSTPVEPVPSFEIRDSLQLSSSRVRESRMKLFLTMSPSLPRSVASSPFRSVSRARRASAFVETITRIRHASLSLIHVPAPRF